MAYRFALREAGVTMPTVTPADRPVESAQTALSPATARYRSAERNLWASVDLTPSETWVSLPRLDVDVRVQTVGTGEPLLFVHGGPTTGSAWTPMLPDLVEEFQCLVLDRPGTGLSEPIDPPVPLQQFADALIVDVLDALEVDRAHLVVSSLGGYVALRTAVAHPDRIDRTVQLGCPGAVPGMTVPLFMRLMAAPLIGRLLGGIPPNERSTEWILRQIGHHASLDEDAFSDELLAWSLSFARDTDTMANDQALMREMMTIRGVEPSLTLSDSLFESVESPTYFLWGEDDPFGGPAVARRTVDRLPNASLELIPDAGHLPWLDVPDHAGAVTRDFLNG